MSSNINILPEKLANKIAAGEVVERPASVVKELVENSIDAGATRIRISTQVGGKASIVVADDGCGMSREDALMCIQRHATSKIATDEDLEEILTLGFRGEALPSIGSISHMIIETKEAEKTAGTRVVVEGGVLKSTSDIGRDVGTTVVVRDLFFNIPARRKFLKTTETEFRHVVQAVTQLALCYPSIAFVLSHNDHEVLNVPRHDSMYVRLCAVFGASFMQEMLRVAFDQEDVKGEGFFGRPTAARRSRLRQMIFVNGRPVISRFLNYAVYAGYGGLLSKENYPPFVVFLSIDPRKVDVNVHPAKREVRLSNEREVSRLLTEKVKDALRTDAVSPEGQADRIPTVSITQLVEEAGHYDSREGRRRQTSLSFIPPPPHERRSREEHVSLWQVHDTYIFAQVKSGIIVIDQHVAHERVLYQEAMESFSGQPSPGQQLLFPLSLELSPTEIHIIEEIRPLLEQMGFGIRAFGRNSVVVDAIPSGLKRWRNGQMLMDMVDQMAKEGRITSGLKEKLAASYSCHAAIKAGEKLSADEMQILIDRLFATREPFVCPHGRPTLVRVSMEDLNRWFGR